jgi:AcrR family transcriptional regulator
LVTAIPRATLYYYFSGKEDLASFYSSWWIERMAEAVRSAAKETGPIAKRLERSVLAGFQLSEADPGVDLAVLRLLSEVGTLAPVLVEARDIAFDSVKELLSEGQASGELAVEDVELALSMIFGACVMAAWRSLLTADGVSHDELSRIIRMLIDGLRPRRRSR